MPLAVIAILVGRLACHLLTDLSPNFPRLQPLQVLYTIQKSVTLHSHKSQLNYTLHITSFCQPTQYRGGIGYFIQLEFELLPFRTKTQSIAPCPPINERLQWMFINKDSSEQAHDQVYQYDDHSTEIPPKVLRALCYLKTPMRSG